MFFPRRNKVRYLRQRLFFRRKRLLQFRKISKFVYRYLSKRRRAVVLRNSVCNSIIRIRKLSFISSTFSKNFKRRKKRMGYTRLKFFKRPKKFRKEFMLFDKLPWIYIYFEPYVYPKYIFLNLVLYHEFAGSYQYGIRFRTGLFLLWNIFFNNFTGRLRFLKFTLVNRSLIFSRSHFLKNLTFYINDLEIFFYQRKMELKLNYDFRNFLGRSNFNLSFIYVRFIFLDLIRVPAKFFLNYAIKIFKQSNILAYNAPRKILIPALNFLARFGKSNIFGVRLVIVGRFTKYPPRVSLIKRIYAWGFINYSDPRQCVDFASQCYYGVYGAYNLKLWIFRKRSFIDLFRLRDLNKLFGNYVFFVRLKKRLKYFNGFLAGLCYGVKKLRRYVNRYFTYFKMNILKVFKQLLQKKLFGFKNIFFRQGFKVAVFTIFRWWGYFRFIKNFNILGIISYCYNLVFLKKLRVFTQFL